MLTKFQMCKIVVSYKAKLHSVCTPRDERAWAAAKRMQIKHPKDDIKVAYNKVLDLLKDRGINSGEWIRQSIYGEKCS